MVDKQHTADTTLERLRLGAINGDKRAGSELFEYLYVRFLSIARRKVGRDNAEDVVQEALVVIAQKLDESKFEKNFAAWCFKILQYKVLNAIRDKASGSRVFARTDLALDFATSVVPDLDLRRAVMSCLQRVHGKSIPYGEILLGYAEGLETSEMCERLNIKANNFYQIMRRGREMLRQCLQSFGYEL